MARLVCSRTVLPSRAGACEVQRHGPARKRVLLQRTTKQSVLARRNGDGVLGSAEAPEQYSWVRYVGNLDATMLLDIDLIARAQCSSSDIICKRRESREATPPMVVVVRRLQRVVHLCAFMFIAEGESGVPFFSLAIPEVLYSRSELHLQITWVIFVDLSTKSYLTHPIHFQEPLRHHVIVFAKMSAPLSPENRPPPSPAPTPSARKITRHHLVGGKQVSRTNQKVSYQALLIQRRTPTRVPFVWDRRRLEDGKVHPSRAALRLALGRLMRMRRRTSIMRLPEQPHTARAADARAASAGWNSCPRPSHSRGAPSCGEPLSHRLSTYHYHREGLPPIAVLEWTLG